MDETAVLQFAFDQPRVPFLPLICCTCLRPVRKSKATEHMNKTHPGWLAQWNQALADAFGEEI